MKNQPPRRELPTLLLALTLLLVAILGCRSTNKPKAPSWAKARVLSANEDHPSQIISDGTAVYFVTGGTVASVQKGTNNIKRILLADGTVSVLIKGGDLIPDEALAVDDRFLYWSGGGNISRVPKGGGASEKIVSHAPHPKRILFDNERIFWLIWAGEGSPPQPIMFAPKNGGEAQELTVPQPPTTGLCLDGGFVYWMTGDGIRKCPKAGGEVSVVYRNPTNWPSLGLQQDAEGFYFAQMNSKGHSALMKLSKKTGEVTQLSPSMNHTMEFVVDEASVYYFDEVPGTGSFGPVALKKVSKAGGDVITVDQGEAGWIRYLAIDAKQVYFTDISKVYALPK